MYLQQHYYLPYHFSFRANLVTRDPPKGVGLQYV